MSDLITALTTLMSFLTTQLFNIADAFLESTIGQVILGITLFSLIVYLVLYVIAKVRG